MKNYVQFFTVIILHKVRLIMAVGDASSGKTQNSLNTNSGFSIIKAKVLVAICLLFIL